jgi:hypothetical protein
MDREVKAPLDLFDEIERELGMAVVPFTWPVGMAKFFGGVVDLRRGQMRVFAPGEDRVRDDDEVIDGLDSPILGQRFGAAWEQAEQGTGELTLTPHPMEGVEHLTLAAAALLKDTGYDVHALFMRNWDEDEGGYCTAAADLQDARRVCDDLDIPLHAVTFAAEYRDRVFQHFLDELAAGRSDLHQHGTPVGRRLPLSASATGRTLLARLEDHEVRALFPGAMAQPSPRAPGTLQYCAGPCP